ncbi:MAG: lipoprotein [Ignavibacteria bacterium]|nr:MAG: lipoprotein [Ignavibacteria bacterium]KAF0159147.1 MAG: lipoprotein [Ignavibacteria bacterium]
MTKTHIAFMSFFLLIVSIAKSQTNVQSDFFSNNNRLKFANHLYNEKDYLRALGEYKEILKLVDNDTIRFRFANSFLKVGRYDEAAQNFKTLFVSSKLQEEAKFSYYQTLFFSGDYNDFRINYDGGFYLPQKYYKVIDRLNSATYFLQQANLPGESKLIKPFDDSVQTKLIYFSQMIKNPPKKNPVTAALLSAAIPGAGKFYSGEITDGLIALGATLLSGFLAVNNFQNNHQFRGWLFTGLTAFFYGGSIYGSAASAKIYNAKLKSDLNKEIKLYFEERNYFLPKIEL